MKTIQKILLGAAVMLVSLLAIGTVYANEGSSQVTVSYIPDKIYAQVNLEVEVKGSGTVYDRKQDIQEGTVIYDMLEEDIKSFRIVPKHGYQIAQIEFYDGYQKIDMRKHLQNETIDIVLKDKDASLKVAFAKTTDSNKSPETGDKTQAGIQFLIMMVTFLILMLLWKKETEKDPQ